MRLRHLAFIFITTPAFATPLPNAISQQLYDGLNQQCLQKVPASPQLKKLPAAQVKKFCMCSAENSIQTLTQEDMDFLKAQGHFSPEANQRIQEVGITCMQSATQ